MERRWCKFCNGETFIAKKVEYVYRHQGQYMLFRDVPAEVCLHCGMRYYAAHVILDLEARFFEVFADQTQAKQTRIMPVETFSAISSSPSA